MLAVVDQRPEAIDVEVEKTDGISVDFDNNANLRRNIFFPRL